MSESESQLEFLNRPIKHRMILWIVAIVLLVLYWVLLLSFGNEVMFFAQLGCFLIPSLAFLKINQSKLFRFISWKIWGKYAGALLLLSLILNGLLQLAASSLELSDDLLEAFKALFHQTNFIGVTLDLLFLAWVPAFAEEFFFRGFLFELMSFGLKRRSLLLGSAFLFALYHLNPVFFPFLFVLGFYFSWVTFKTQSIWPAVICHGINNSVGVILFHIFF